MARLRTVLLAQLAASGVALGQSGEVFTWTDEAGVTHFVDDARAVPAGAKARRSTSGAVGHVLTTALPTVKAPAAPRPAKAGTTVARTAARPEPYPPTAQPQAPCPPDRRDVEAEWRARFAQVRSRILEHQASLRADRRLLEPGVLGPWYNCGGGNVPYSYGGAGPFSTGGFGACGPVMNPWYDAAQWRVGVATELLAAARRELRTLERAAADEGIPLEWRALDIVIPP